MRLPLLYENVDFYPKEGVCPVCRQARVVKPHSYASLQGGAALFDDITGAGGPSPSMRGYLYLHWQGAQTEGEELYPEITALAPIADAVEGGQFAIAACSIQCLRELLGRLVDKLDQEIRRAQGSMKKRR